MTPTQAKAIGTGRFCKLIAADPVSKIDCPGGVERAVSPWVVVAGLSQGHLVDHPA